MPLRTRFTDAYGLDTPIAQAGMAFVGMTPDLAVAVSNAGALGSLGVGLMPAPALAQTVAAIQAGTCNPFNVNFITIFTDQAQIDAVCAAGVAVASFHWGHPPRGWIDRLHDAGVRVFEQVGSVADAKRAVDDGVDVVVAQGLEAGGHNYATLPTFALVPVIADAVAPALVLASGGITDGRGLAAALMLGADGVWVGTRFVATAVHKFSNLVPMRNLTTGDLEEMAFLAGQGVGLVRSVEPAAAVVAAMTADACAALTRYA